MKAKVSELMDGELDGRDAEALLGPLAGEGEAREAWRRYHLIGDAMRGERLLAPGFAERVAARLAAEPTVLAPRPKARLEQRRWQVLSAAASLAAVAFVLSVAFAPQEETAPLAQSATPAAARELAEVAPPEAAGEYVLAHQGYSPRNTLQGMAHYVRTVSSDTRGAGR